MTVEEIDQALLRIAAFNPLSSPEVRSLAETWEDGDEVGLLGRLYSQLQARESKWLTRLVLKSYAPVVIPEDLNLGSSHSNLPRCLTVSIQFPVLAPAAIRKDGIGMIRGLNRTVSDNSPRSMSVLPPSSSALPTAVLARTNSLPTPAPAELISCSLPEAAINAPCSSATTHQLPSSQPTSYLTSPKKSSHSKGISVLPSSQPSAISNTSQRTVLGTISANLPSSQSQSQFSQHISSPSKPSNPKAKTVHFNITGNGTCRLSATSCSLSNCMFLLAPCVAPLPYLTENLLPWHGCHRIASLSSLGHPSLPQTCPKTQKKYRKLVLVESNRPKETVAFLKKIRALGLKRRGDGKKDWVEVYDWRLLECVAKMDRGKELGYNPWRRCWIGAV